MAGLDRVGFAVSTLGKNPVNGLRHPETSTTTGWYVWCGESVSEEADFFETLCVDHLLELLPAVADFRALPPGYRFLTDGDYRDIWFDETLLRV